jgi:hypothetical protein
MKRRFSFIALLCVFLIFSKFGTFSFASENTIKESPIQSFFTSVKHDVLHVAASPFHMSKSGALQLASFAAFNSLLVYGFDGAADEEFGIEVDDIYMKPAKELVKLGKVYDRIGSANVHIGLSATMLTGSIIFKDKKLLKTTRLMIESAVMAGGITYLGKGLTGRSRPYANRGAYDFSPLKFSDKEEYRALPSGHTASAFSMMTVIAKQYDQWWIQIPAYTLAVSVALQRMDSRNHWASDVVVGGAIGYWVGNTLVNRHKKKPRINSFRPYISRHGVGMTLRFK